VPHWVSYRIVRLPKCIFLNPEFSLIDFHPSGLHNEDYSYFLVLRCQRSNPLLRALTRLKGRTSEGEMQLACRHASWIGSIYLAYRSDHSGGAPVASVKACSNRYLMPGKNVLMILFQKPFRQLAEKLVLLRCITYLLPMLLHLDNIVLYWLPRLLVLRLNSSHGFPFVAEGSEGISRATMIVMLMLMLITLCQSCLTAAR
jgi:hypothetical protein